MDSKGVKHVSECFIKPKYVVKESNQPYHLSSWDLTMLASHYIQKGLLFAKPKHDPDFCIDKFLETLKESLSLTLVHYYPLAGQLVTIVDEDRGESLVYVDCKKGPGARFIHASIDVTMSDILSPPNVPLVVRSSFFDHDKAPNHDGHFRPLLSVQVTELLDGIFIGCSMNHVLADGTSYWHFWNVWSEIHMADGEPISVSRPPAHKKWFLDGHGPIFLPYTQPDQFVSRFEAASQLKERFFHFSSNSIARLKGKAKEESKSNKISSFQALSAFVWRAVVRANSIPHDQITSCRLAVNNRNRLEPTLPQEYFGTSLNVLKATTTAGNLLEQTPGWTALLLHKTIVSHTDKSARDFVQGWLKSPVINPISMFDPSSIMISGSPRFDMYGNEFGLGKAVAVRSGHAHKYVGKVIAYPGREEGSVDLEICLMPDSMKALESDKEFMTAVSFPL